MTIISKYNIIKISLIMLENLFFYFIFKLYIIVLVLPNIKMNPPQVYMCWFNICNTFNSATQRSVTMFSLFWFLVLMAVEAEKNNIFQREIDRI